MLNIYKNELQKAKQGSNSRSYPVAQSQVWENDIDGLWDNLYGLINFIKWIWIKLYYEEGGFYDAVNCDQSSLSYYVLIETLQQMIFKVQSTIKGARKNDYKNVEKSPFVGISDIVNEKLLRKIRNKPYDNIEPWVHAKQRCFVPYFGGYGKMTKLYRENVETNMYSSVKCGMSGSVNYFLFLYLLSTIVTDDKSLDFNPKRLITLLCVILAGDGGHTIREIIFGLTSAVILLYHLIADVKNELALHYGIKGFKDNIGRVANDSNWSWIWNNKDSIISILLTKIKDNVVDKINKCKNITVSKDDILRHTMINTLNALTNWEPSINELYKITADINIVGIDKSDIINSGLDVSRPFEYFKREAYLVLFGIKKYGINNDTKLLTDVPLSNDVQLFYALDNDRYKLDKDISFKTSADVKMEAIIKYLYTGIYEKVDKQTRDDIKHCFPDIDLNIHIPFA